MSETLISFGANLGNSRQLIRMAGELVQEEFGRANVSFSRMYRSPAVGGPPGQDDFYNAVARIQSNASPFDVWQSLHRIEQTLGRRRRLRWEARPIDLDVLLHDNVRIWTPTFKVPHPRMVLRTFIVEPTAEVAPDWVEPVTQQTIAELCSRLRQGCDESPAHARKAWVFVENEAIHAVLQDAFARERFLDHRSVEEVVTLICIPPIVRPWQTLSMQQSYDLMAEHIATDPIASAKLVVFAGASPDATTVHWEDYYRGWAMVLGITGQTSIDDRSTTSRQQLKQVPKYLLAANDPTWAAHELKAVLTGMECPVYACGTFFDED